MTHVAVTDWLDRAQALADKATPGRWRVCAMKVMAGPLDDSDYDKHIDVAQTYHLNKDGRPRTFDADFIAAARGDLPRLVEAVRTVLDIADEIATTPATATQLATAARLQDAVYTALFDPPRTPGAPS